MTRYNSSAASNVAGFAASVASPFEVRPIAGKGSGVIAVRDIERGERLLAEAPFLQVQGGWQDLRKELVHGIFDDLRAALRGLSPAERAKFFELTQNPVRFGAQKTATGVFATNGIPFDHHGQPRVGVFLTAARFNHACNPNAIYRWNANLGRLTIHACQPIAAGCEVRACSAHTPRTRCMRVHSPISACECLCRALGVRLLWVRRRRVSRQPPGKVDVLIRLYLRMRQVRARPAAANHHERFRSLIVIPRGTPQDMLITAVSRVK